MARALRIVASGLTYHVWARGTGKMRIYRDDRDREEFLCFVEKSFADNRVEGHAICLMENHYHAVITTLEANLPRAIQQVNAPYAQWWNHRHSRPGHVFQGRYGAQVVQDDAYLLTVVRYVVLNPVRAGLVDSPEQWRWSSYRATAGLAPVPSFLRPDVVWQQLGGGLAGCCQRYREFVAMGHAGRLPDEPVLGDGEFVRRFEEQRGRASHEVPRDQRRTRLPLARFLDGASTRSGREAGSRAAHAAGYSLKEIGDVLGVHYTTVSKMISRAAARGLPTAGERIGVRA